MNLSIELENIETSVQFKSWLDYLDGGAFSSKILTKNLLVSGYCEDLAVYLYYKYGAEVWWFDRSKGSDGHFFVKKDGKFYDALNPTGVNNISDLEFSKTKVKNIDVDNQSRKLDPKSKDWWSVYPEAWNKINIL